MAFLMLAGLTVSVAKDSYEETPREIGETTQAYDGTLRRSRQTVKHDAAFDMPAQDLASAAAWEALLQGLGETWHFDTFYGSKGTTYSGSATGLSIDSITKKFGASSLKITAAGPPNSITLPVGLGSTWTVATWRKQAAGAWQHYLVTSDGKKWVDGVRNDAASTTWLTVASSVVLAGHASDQVNYDDLVIFPFAVLDAWPPIWGAATAAFSNLPQLALAGDGIQATRTVLGAVSSSKAVGRGALKYRTLSVTLQEV